MSLLNTRTARSMIYLVCIGGLLVCNAWVVMVLWNTVLWPMTPSNEQLNFLEGAGLTAFAYVIVFTVRYGRKAAKTPTTTADAHQRTHSPSHHAGTPQHSELSALCSSMTAEEKARLKHELAARAGCKEEIGREYKIKSTE